MGSSESLTWTDLWMQMAHLMAKKSKDGSFKAGAVLVAADGKTRLGDGFNGPPPYVSDDIDQSDRPLVRTLTCHAESNCLWFAVAAHSRKALEGSTLYVNGFPCSQCVKEAVRAGVKEIVYDDTNPIQPKMVDQEDQDRSLQLVWRSKLNITRYSKVKGT